MSNDIKKLEELFESGYKLLPKTEEDKLFLIEGLAILPKEAEILMSPIELAREDNTTELFLNSISFEKALFKPKRRGVILIDLVGYSNRDMQFQCAILSVFNRGIRQAIRAMNLSRKIPRSIEAIIPTGDGCYIIFNEDINEKFFRSVLFIIQHIKLTYETVLKRFDKDIVKYKNLCLRIACTLNEIDSFRDLASNINFYGTGMNEAARILEGGKDVLKSSKEYNGDGDVVFVDESVFAQAKLLLPVLKKWQSNINVQDLGDVEDKHQMSRKVWCFWNLPSNISLDFFAYDHFLREYK